MPPADEERALAAAALCGTAGAWSERPGVVRAYFEQAGSVAEGDAAARIERAFALAWAALSDTAPSPRARARLVPETDWLARWREAARPLEAASGVWVAPPGADPPAAARDPGAVLLVILPGQGFGTGTHPTTRALLAWLAREPRGDSVLDVGTGSGILALAALALGARRATGLEIDAAAIDNAAENRVLNQGAKSGWRGAERLFLIRGSLDALRPGARFDRVLANLDRRALDRLMPELAARVAPGGHLGLAGLLAGEEREIVARATAAGLTLVEAVTGADPASGDVWWSGWFAPLSLPA